MHIETVEFLANIYGVDRSGKAAARRRAERSRMRVLFFTLLLGRSSLRDRGSTPRTTFSRGFPLQFIPIGIGKWGVPVVRDRHAADDRQSWGSVMEALPDLTDPLSLPSVRGRALIPGTLNGRGIWANGARVRMASAFGTWQLT